MRNRLTFERDVENSQIPLLPAVKIVSEEKSGIYTVYLPHYTKHFEKARSYVSVHDNNDTTATNTMLFSTGLIHSRLGTTCRPILISYVRSFFLMNVSSRYQNLQMLRSLVLGYCNAHEWTETTKRKSKCQYALHANGLLRPYYCNDGTGIGVV